MNAVQKYIQSKISLEDLGHYKYIILLVFITLALSWVYFFQKGVNGESSIILVIAVLLGIYMAMNIGANDVANNMGPAVGSKALTLGGAILIAAIFEAGGALIAGGDVVNTIKKGIIDPSLITDPNVYLAIMMSTLIGAALWINIATYVKAPVSATHSVIGGLIGAGVAGVGVRIVDWSQISTIVASWIISPLLGGLIAAGITISITRTILTKENKDDAAKIWVPIYVGFMTWAFSAYLIMKGFKNLFKQYHIMIGFDDAIFIGFVIAVVVTISMLVYLRKKGSFLKNSKKSINKLFNIPLVFAVALLSFAHGANDVANAIGPLAAIVDILQGTGDINGKVGIPFWVMMIGAMGLAFGLTIFGGRLIKTVGNEITKLNQSRAFAVALAAAITVIIASQLGLPVSSTHIAIGGIFGVGLIRQLLKHIHGKEKHYIEKGMIRNIALAWIITLPASAAIAAGTFYIIMFLNKVT